MNIKVEKSDPIKKKTKLVVYFVTEKSELPLGLPKLNQKLVDEIKKVVKETKAKLGAIAILHTHQLVEQERILIAGLGQKHKISDESLRFDQ